MDFASDNIAGASPAIIEALAEANSGAATPYGADTYTDLAAKRLSEIFERDCAVSLVATGTAANALSLGSLSPPWGAILCHADAHIMDSECGAPELFTGGAKLVGIPGAGAKITPEALGAAMAPFGRGVFHQVQLAALSLSQATECGTIYSVDEIGALSEQAHAAGLGVHMDGARFTNALLTLGCSPAAMTWKAGIDVLSLGATKNGAMACEAVVFFDPAKAQNFAFQKKRSGHILSKGRFLGAQMAAYLKDGHWLDLARHANACAATLAAGLATIPGIGLPWPTQANEVFALLPKRVDGILRAAGVHYYTWSMAGLPAAAINADAEGEPPVFARLICSFATDPADVDRLIGLTRDAASTAKLLSPVPPLPQS